MNQSKVFFPELDALQFPELKALQDKMNARSKPDIDRRLEDGLGEPVHGKNFEIDREIPIIQNRKSVLYLQDVWNYKRAFNGAEPKYHVVYCKPLQRMRTRGNYENLFATRRTDGQFFVKFSVSNKLSLHKLSICQVCLKELRTKFGSNIFPTDPEKFPLADWLELFFDYSSDEWKERSQTCREKANWTCQECGTNLKFDSHFLHAHHKWGTKYDDPEEFMGKYGDEWIAYINSKELDIEVGF